jgi:UPF0271 protein
VSPGGWNLIGQTPLMIADVAEGFFPIRAGDRVRFVGIGRDEFEARKGERLMSGVDSIDLNADLGEGFPNDEALLHHVRSASVSCGAHAGDEAAILATLKWARLQGVCVGAHPGYPDREGFGRRDQAWEAEPLAREIVRQVAYLSELARRVGVTLRYIKPHGALYNQAQSSGPAMRAVVEAASRLGLPLVGLPGSDLAAKARAAGVPYLGEGFLDRRYDSDGRLVPRSRLDALLTDPTEIAAQTLALAGRGDVQTLCIHGDRPGAVEEARRARDLLAQNGIRVQAAFGAKQETRP